MLLVTLVAAAFLGAARLGPSAEAPFVRFERVVPCGPGWRVVVYPSGRAHQKVEDSCLREEPYSRDHELSSADVASLRRALDEAEFTSLPDEVRADSVYPDEDAFVITVYEKGREKRVLARGLERASSSEARRFRAVWEVLADLVPDPRAEERRRR